MQEMQDNWNIIEQHGASIVKFGDVQQMKNDVKIATFINKRWQSYMSPENNVLITDNNKAEEHCSELLAIQLRNTESPDQIERRKQDIIERNNIEKDNAFKEYIIDAFD